MRHHHAAALLAVAEKELFAATERLLSAVHALPLDPPLRALVIQAGRDLEEILGGVRCVRWQLDTEETFCGEALS